MDFETWVKEKLDETKLKVALLGWISSQYSAASYSEKELLEEILVLILTSSLHDILIDPEHCDCLYHVAAEYLSSQVMEIYKQNREGRFE